MSVKVGINGFGRIGRNILRAAIENRNIDFVAVNDLPVPTASLAHLLKYDSILGELKVNVEAKEGMLIVNGKEVKVDWRFNTTDARIKLKKLYPLLQE